MASSSSTATIGTPTVPNGPAFVLVRFEKKGLSFRNTSPYKIRDVLKGMLACAPKEVSAIRSGALLIHTRDLSQTDALLKWRSFEGEEIRVMPADRLNQKEGLVYAPELMYESVETILSESEVQGVTKVTRLRSKTSRPNPLLKISFAAVDLPSHLYAAYLRYEVRPCVPLPRRCSRCLRYGHGQGTCRARAQRCMRCAGGHSAEGCDAPPHCVACQGPHPVTDRNCPVWIGKVEALHAKSQRQQTTNRTDPEEWPALPTPDRMGRESRSSGRVLPAARSPPTPSTGQLYPAGSPDASPRPSLSGEVRHSPVEPPAPISTGGDREHHSPTEVLTAAHSQLAPPDGQLSPHEPLDASPRLPTPGVHTADHSPLAPPTRERSPTKPRSASQSGRPSPTGNGSHTLASATQQPQQPSPQPEILRPPHSAPPRYSSINEVRRSPDRDSDDSTTCFSSDDDDEPTPKAKVSWSTPGQRSPSGSEEVSPPTPPPPQPSAAVSDCAASHLTAAETWLTGHRRHLSVRSFEMTKSLLEHATK